MSETSSHDSAARQPEVPVSTRMRLATLMIARLLVLPAIAGLLLGSVLGTLAGWEGEQLRDAANNGAFGAVIGSFVAFLMSSAQGWRTAINIVVPLTLVTAGAALLVPSPGDGPGDSGAWILLLAVLGGASGFAARYGHMPALAIIGLAASIAQPLDSWAETVPLLVMIPPATFYGVSVARRYGASEKVETFHAPVSRSNVAIILGSLGAATAGWLATLFDENGYWLPMTFFILLLPAPGLDSPRSRAKHRVAGTVLGVGVALVVEFMGLGPLIRVILGGLSAVLAITFPKPPWRSAAFVAFAVVTLVDYKGVAPEIAVDRLVATLVGAAVLVAIATLELWWDRAHPASDESRDVFNEFRASTAEDGGATAPGQ